MKIIFWIVFLFSAPGFAATEFGVGTSNVTAGRLIPSLALGYETTGWGLLFRGEGVQTSIYAQNAWTAGWYKLIGTTKFTIGSASIGAGLGATYVKRAYRESLTAEIETDDEFVVGPHLVAKFYLGSFYIGFDTVLGLTSEVVQHVVLNFQDVSHFVIGFSL